MFSRLKRLNYRHCVPDALLIAASLYLSLYLRLGAGELGMFLPTLNKYLLVFVGLRMGTLALMGAYDIIWRFISLKDALRLSRALLISSLVILSASYLIDIGRLPRAVFIIDTFMVTVFLGMIRFARRWAFEAESGKELMISGRPALIYGAGSAGRILAQRLATDRQLGFRVVGFIDDDPEKIRRIVSGIRVLGKREDIPSLCKGLSTKTLFVAISKPSGDFLRQLVVVCRPLGIRPRILSAAQDASLQEEGPKFFRDIELSDLLNRPSRQMDISGTANLIRGKRVLVTGAGGSIGSELVRQILRLNPGSLLLLDHSEYNLYQIDQEAKQLVTDSSRLIPLLADLKDLSGLSQIFKIHEPEIIFHAAAYKHVHLVEKNPFSSILNNIQGTKNLLELAEETDVETFVLISTDKAVNPVGIMGSTKRVCELMVAEQGRRLGRRYCAVRFGNVLGSSGSLIPLLKSQIENREPLTITHKDIKRYFMLISEAVSLVMKAASISESGDICVLRMGDPIKIVDIAHSLLALMGRSEEECPIIFTGLRPGEKMFEELYICGNEINTEDPDILVLPRGDGSEIYLNPETPPLFEIIERILSLTRLGNQDAVLLINELVRSESLSSLSGPIPSEENTPRLWQ